MKTLLTKREKEILFLIVEEHSSQSIASALNLSLHTIDSHRKNILRKTKSKSLIGLLKFAIQAGLLKNYYYQATTTKRTKLNT